MLEMVSSTGVESWSMFTLSQYPTDRRTHTHLAAGHWCRSSSTWCATHRATLITPRCSFRPGDRRRGRRPLTNQQDRGGASHALRALLGRPCPVVPSRMIAEVLTDDGVGQRH